MEQELRKEAADVADAWGVDHAPSRDDIGRMVAGWLEGRATAKEYDPGDWDVPAFYTLLQAVGESCANRGRIAPTRAADLLEDFAQELIDAFSGMVLNHWELVAAPDYLAEHNSSPNAEQVLDNQERAREANRYG